MLYLERLFNHSTVQYTDYQTSAVNFYPRDGARALRDVSEESDDTFNQI